VWFQDEARVGQQGTLTRIWAKRGTRPRAPRDTRYKWSYIFGAACPARGSAAGLILPYVNTEAMGLHLDEIAKAVKRGSHALLIVDGAGWHGAKGLRVPPNITLLKLPPYAPELNPMENVWQYLRANKLAITVFDTYEEILVKPRMTSAIRRRCQVCWIKSTARSICSSQMELTTENQHLIC
jgi:transposase